MTIHTDIQLDLMGGLYQKDKTTGAFIKELIGQIKDYKYLRAKLEGFQALKHDTEPDFGTYSYASNAIGNVMYYLATLAHQASRGISYYSKKDRDWFYDKTVLSVPINPAAGFSMGDLYSLSRNTKSSLEGLIMANQRIIDKDSLYNRLISEALESADTVHDYIKGLA